MNRNSFMNVVADNGATKRDREKKNLIHNVNVLSCDSISYKDVKINDVETYLTIVSGTMANKKNISSKCGEEFHVGDIVEYCDTKWLILTADVDNEIYVRGQMQECNYRLRWQNKNGDIVEYDCIIQSASQYNSGEESLKTITIGYNQDLIYIPLNEDTVCFKSDDRFFIDNNKVNPKVYRATRVDTVTGTYNGVGYVIVLMTEDQYNPETDNIEKFVCDYREIVPDTSDIVISYKGKSEIVCGGSYKTFTVDRNVTWNIDGIPELISCIKTEIFDDKIKIKCLNNLSLIGSTVNLSCIDDAANTGQIYINIISSV